MKKVLLPIVALVGLSLTSCSPKKTDPMKECMKSLSHMQCVKKLNKE
mgnify:CR=1 FL=1